MSHAKKGDTTRQGGRIGVDSAKGRFPVQGVDAQRKVVIGTQLTGGKVLTSFAHLPSCLVGVEAWGGAQ